MSYDFDGCEDRSPPQVIDYVPAKHDLEVIVTCLELAAIFLTPGDGSTFTFEELFREAHALGGKEFDLSEKDVRIVLPGMKSIKKLPGRHLCLV
jgi:hypothetical protein